MTTPGFGGGNDNDPLMEQLADAGNGSQAYIDTLGEARTEYDRFRQTYPDNEPDFRPDFPLDNQ